MAGVLEFSLFDSKHNFHFLLHSSQYVLIWDIINPWYSKDSTVSPHCVLEGPSFSTVKENRDNVTAQYTDLKGQTSSLLTNQFLIFKNADRAGSINCKNYKWKKKLSFRWTYFNPFKESDIQSMIFGDLKKVLQYSIFFRLKCRWIISGIEMFWTQK